MEEIQVRKERQTAANTYVNMKNYIDLTQGGRATRPQTSVYKQMTDRPGPNKRISLLSGIPSEKKQAFTFWEMKYPNHFNFWELPNFTDYEWYPGIKT